MYFFQENLGCTFCQTWNTTDLEVLRPVLDSWSLVGWCVGPLGLPGIVFDHQPDQAPLTRPLEIVVVALLGLETRMSEVERITRGADSVVKIFGKSEKSSIFKVFCLLWEFNSS